MQRIMPLGLILLFSVGCSNEPPKLDPAKRVEKTPPVVIPKLEHKDAPKESDPAAIAIVDTAIAAHTHGYPERIDKLHSLRLTRTGRIGPPQHWPVESVVTMRWLGEYHISFSLNGRQGFFLCYNNNGGRWNTNEAQQPESIPEKQLNERRQDNSWEWLWTLVPLRDPKVIVGIEEEQTIEGLACDAIRVWHPSLSDAILYFDKASHQLRGIVSIGSEEDADIVKLNVIHTTAEFDGIILPKTMTQRSAKAILFEWTFDKIEMEPKIEDGLFKGELE